MCGNPFKTPKTASAPPAPPPPPPASESPRAPAYDEGRREEQDEGDGALVRRLGRSALRIDLQAPSGQGLGLANK